MYSRSNNKVLKSIRVDRQLYADMQKRARDCGSITFSSWLEWAFRKLVYPPEKCIRVYARDLAAELAILQERMMEMAKEKEREQQICQIGPETAEFQPSLREVTENYK